MSDARRKETTLFPSTANGNAQARDIRWIIPKANRYPGFKPCPQAVETKPRSIAGKHQAIQYTDDPAPWASFRAG
ncbi:hypothetical protein N7449_004946 [Penicillium cf. viridicatum]|uniref:Uncharacterized protein n=1 Tax=Penicillium cf. viridicatum TaxID=2972119 RepID=A0A9W9MKK3_9EURO|nr:hypothetical protein N7449_004946 [Penicillium cf. viridicatum]